MKQRLPFWELTYGHWEKPRDFLLKVIWFRLLSIWGRNYLKRVTNHQRWGVKPPTPNTENDDENFWVLVSRDNMGIWNNKFASKQYNILVSKYPDNFYKKWNIWDWNRG